MRSSRSQGYGEGFSFCWATGSIQKFGMNRDEFGAVQPVLGEMQQNLFDRALKLRMDNTHDINNESEFRDFFTATNENEFHGGFANCHFADEQSIDLY